MFSMAMWMAAIVAPLQILAGDMHGLNTLEHQPAKVMAMEGHFESHPDGAPLILFGWPDQAGRRGSLRHLDPEGLVADPQARPERAARRASTRWPRANWPPVPIVFWSFRVMVGLGLLMLALGALQPARALPRHGSTTGARCTALRSLMGPAGFVAVIAGWVTTEVGRQPFTVYGLLRTADSVSPLAGAGGRAR